MFINLYKKVISNQNRPYNADDYLYHTNTGPCKTIEFKIKTVIACPMLEHYC